MQKISTLLICVLVSICTVSAQDFSNKGKEFWIAYPAHIDGTQSVMGLYITSDKNATGTIQINGSTIPFTVTPNLITRKFLGSSGAVDGTNANVYLSAQDGIKVNAAVKITADVPVVVYAHIIKSARSAATLALPTQVLGTKYIVPSYPSVGGGGTGAGIGEIAVIATQPNTIIEINSTATGMGGRAAGVPFQITLANPGDCYQFQSQQNADISGSTVKSVSVGSATCKPIAVFSATTWSAFDCAGSSGGDNLFQELFPTRSWGKQFITAPFINRPEDIYRIYLQDSSTVVTVTDNATTFTLGVSQYSALGKFYEYKTNQPVLINADKAISVVQYITSQTCKTGCAVNSTNPTCFADPEMVILNPVEQTLKDITFFSAHQNFVPAGQTQVELHYVNLIINKNFKSTLKIDGAKPKAAFIDIPGTNYSYVQEDLSTSSATNPVHIVKADTGFSAIVYGYGRVESYGYNGGTNIIDLYQYVTIKNEYGSVNFPATCKGTPFNFSITLPYQPIKLNWDFGGDPTLSPNTNILQNAPIPVDSSFIKDGKTLYVYKLSGTYTFSATGSHIVKVLVNNPTSDGCSGDQEIFYEVQVFDKPIADWTATSSGCANNPVNFTDNTNTFGRINIKWKWDFGDATKDSVQNPIKTYATPGTYNVKLTAITDIGCISDTTKPITLSPAPIAKFIVSDTICEGATVLFKDSSSIASGYSIKKWYWDFGNGIKDTLTTNASLSTVYNTYGTYTVTLIIESSTGCKSIAFTRQIQVRPNPKVVFTLPAGICLPKGASQFTSNSTIKDGTESSFTFNWDFGDGGTDNVRNPIHTYFSAGPFNIKLTVTSLYGCAKDSSQQLSTVYPQAKANFGLKPEICLRDTAFFIDSSDGKGSTVVKWRWDFGDGKTDTVQNPYHIYTTAKTDSVALYVYTDKGCISDTIKKQIVVNPLPTASFIARTTLCEKNNITLTSSAAANVGTISDYYWNGNNITNAGASNNSFSSLFNVSGSYTIKHAVTNSKGCKSDTLVQIIAINPLPKPGFILPEVCLTDAFGLFKDTSSISDGSQNLFAYLWNFGDIYSTVTNPDSATIKNPQHQYSAQGYYDVRLKVTSKDGCIDSLKQVLTVNGAVPVADFSIANNTNLCSNDSVRIQNLSTVDFGVVTAVEIYWDNVNQPTVKYVDNFPYPNKVYSNLYANFPQPATKSFDIKFLAYSGGSCVSTKIQTITLHQSPKILFTTIPGICHDTIPRQITQANEVGSVPGTFIFSGVGVNATGLYSPGAVAPGSYPIQYTYISTGFNCRDSATQNIVVWKSPEAKWGVSDTLCEKNYITFTDSSVANFSKIKYWYWNFDDGNTSQKSNGNKFTYKYQNGKDSYHVSLIVETDSGCRSTFNIQPVKINYLPNVNYSLPSICLPDGNGTFYDSSSIKDSSEALFRYRWSFGDPNDPNPSNTTLKNPVHQYTGLGSYPIRLRVYTKDNCVDSASKTLTTIYPEPIAKFSATPDTICIGDSIRFKFLGNGITSPAQSWVWDLGGFSSTVKNPVHQFTDSGIFKISMYFYNAQQCRSNIKDSVFVVVYPYPVLELGPDLKVLQGGTIPLTPQSVYGTDLQYLWTPNLYLSSNTAAVPYSSPLKDLMYQLTLTGIGHCTVKDSFNVEILKAPMIPNAFSPNGDGVNDTWEIKYLNSYPGCTVSVFNRYGQQVFYSKGYSRDWKGTTLSGDPLPVGVYYYIIDPKFGRAIMTGSVTIVK